MAAMGWRPETPKAVVVLVHGLGEHINRYQHVADAFVKAGYAMQAFDLRGHGKSAGQRGHTPTYESLMDDIADFIADAQKRYPDLPVFFYGHSMGGNHVINYDLRSLQLLFVTFKSWDGFYHEIHNEPEKIEVIQTMIDWMDKAI
jgi:alpha-beta hydrolase superfamily lysophospholipase